MGAPPCGVYEGGKQRQRATGNLIGDRSARASLRARTDFQSATSVVEPERGGDLSSDCGTASI